MKNKLQIKIFWKTFTYPIPAEWTELTQYQVERILSILERKNTKNILVKIAYYLLIPKNQYFRKLLLFYFLTPEAIRAMLPVAKKFTNNIKLSPTQIKHLSPIYICSDMNKITFGQFIDADSYLQLNKIEHLLAVLYTPHSLNRKTDLHASEILRLPIARRYAAYLQFVQFRETIINRLNQIAKDYPSPKDILQPDFSWRDIIFSLSENSININQYAALPLNQVIAEIEYKAQTAFYTRKNIERQSKT